MTVADNVILGKGVKIFHVDLVNLYGCSIGDQTTIGPFIEIQSGVEIGTRCKLSSHSFICDGVTIDDEVFIGHGVMFINDIYPYATNEDGSLQSADDWQMTETRVMHRASIGSNATIMGGVTIGKNALIGAGAVVTKNIPDFSIAVGVPARIVGDVRTRNFNNSIE